MNYQCFLLNYSFKDYLTINITLSYFIEGVGEYTACENHNKNRDEFLYIIGWSYVPIADSDHCNR